MYAVAGPSFFAGAKMHFTSQNVIPASLGVRNVCYLRVCAPLGGRNVCYLRAFACSELENLEVKNYAFLRAKRVLAKNMHFYVIIAIFDFILAVLHIL